jgi:hypothetical protein
MGVVGIANWQFMQVLLSFSWHTRLARGPRAGGCVVHRRDARAIFVSETLVFEASQCQNLRRVLYFRVLI